MEGVEEAVAVTPLGVAAVEVAIVPTRGLSSDCASRLGMLVEAGERSML